MTVTINVSTGMIIFDLKLPKGFPMHHSANLSMRGSITISAFPNIINTSPDNIFLFVSCSLFESSKS